MILSGGSIGLFGVFLNVSLKNARLLRVYVKITRKKDDATGFQSELV